MPETPQREPRIQGIPAHCSKRARATFDHDGNPVWRCRSCNTRLGPRLRQPHRGSPNRATAAKRGDFHCRFCPEIIHSRSREAGHNKRAAHERQVHNIRMTRYGPVEITNTAVAFGHQSKNPRGADA